jgi:TetR/AcrR family tetracycline transcriptional repressor
MKPTPRPRPAKTAKDAPPRSATGDGAGLTSDQVLQVALSLLRKGGLDAVSMRKIAARLGVRAPSLYWHVESKEALHRLMSRTIFLGCLDAIPPCNTWQQWLREYGLSLWRAQCATPDIRQLIVSTPLERNERDTARARILSQLTPLGLPPEIGDVAQQSVQALVTGWTTLRAKPGVDSVEDVFRESLDALIAGWETRARSTRDVARNEARHAEGYARTPVAPGEFDV